MQNARTRYALAPCLGPVLAALVFAGVPTGALAAGPDLSASAYAATPYTLASTCDAAKPHAVINLTLRNSGDAATEAIVLKALDARKELSGEVAIPPIAPGSVREVQVPLRGADRGPSAGTHAISVFLGSHALMPLAVQVPPNRCSAPGAITAVRKAGTTTPAVAEPVANHGAVLGASTPSAPPTLQNRVISTPDPPIGLTTADPSDCGSNAAVRAASGGTDGACRARLNDGAVIMVWAAYHDSACPDPAGCSVTGYRLYAYRSERQIAAVNGQEHTAVLVPGAKLGDCFAVRALRFPRESRSSRGSCVTVVRTTQSLTLGPSEVGQFQAIAHDNADADYCTRNSWDRSWAGEPYGFVVHTQRSTPDPNAGGGGVRLTIGWLAQEHPGTRPFPCKEGLVHVWRGYLNFTVPSEARQRDASIVFAFTPVGDARATERCFHYLWRPHHWVYNPGQGASPTIGTNDGRMLDPGNDPFGLLQLGNGRASFDLSNEPGLRTSGLIGVALAAFGDGIDTNEIAHPTLYQGKYIVAGGSATCGVNDPHLEITYVRTRSIPAPSLPPDLQLQQTTPAAQAPSLSKVRPTPTSPPPN